MRVARSEHRLLLSGDGDQDKTGIGVERDMTELYVLRMMGRERWGVDLT